MKKIMIVEDDKDICRELKEMLDHAGYEGVVLSDFHDGCRQILKAKPDLVLLDITLPSYNGFYWCREIRKLFKMPIIFLSSASDNMNIVMAMDMGAITSLMTTP